MAFEQDITALVTATDQLTGVVDNKIGEIDSRVTQAEGQVNAYIANARTELPFYRLTKNQVLSGTDQSIPSYWRSGAGMTFTLIQSVNTGIEWADRTPEEQSLLTAMGKSGIKHIYQNFNIWRMDWISAEPIYTMYQRINMSTPSTTAAMTKLLSGIIDGHWANGVTSEWKLTGSYHGRDNLSYRHPHPYKRSETGSLLFALPATVAGHVPLDANVWGTFPYIGDNQND